MELRLAPGLHRQHEPLREPVCRFLGMWKAGSAGVVGRTQHMIQSPDTRVQPAYEISWRQIKRRSGARRFARHLHQRERHAFTKKIILDIF